MNKNFSKYKKYPKFNYKQRTWPENEITAAPIWCSVGLRDGNQSLPNPMTIEQKLKFFKLLVNMGFKEIEIGFPSASDTEFNFLRTLIEEGHIPEDVTIQVLTQAREHLINRTFEALKGVKRAIVHVYNSTSTQQREVVFGKSKEEIKKIAIEGAILLETCSKNYPGSEYVFEYSPESFTGTEMEYALEVVEAVLDVWKPTKEHKAIINLPATVEMSMPNVFADQIEWFLHNLSNREAVIISLHTHNDRGTGVAASELGLLAGADRIEGTLFGNGERTGNLDILNVALNLYSQGINPGIWVENMNEIIETYEECTGMQVSPRHPYAGELVYTAFSGSHQDAIKKGLDAFKKQKSRIWDVPYLPLDPDDIGRKYEPIIRINSQSGKGGVAFILEAEYGYKVPKKMQPEISKFVQAKTDEISRELRNPEILQIFEETFVNIEDTYTLVEFSYSYNGHKKQEMIVEATIGVHGEEKTIHGKGNGPVSAFFHGLKEILPEQFTLNTYEEHALANGANSEAAAYIQLGNESGEVHFGVGRDENISSASIRGIVSALNKF